MTKVKQGLKVVNNSPNTNLKAIKNNPIQKKKNKQFANTPDGKVRLVNGKKVQNNNSTEKKLNNKQKEEEEVIKDSPDSPDNNESDKSSIEDINEGIVLPEDSIVSQDDDDDDNDDDDEDDDSDEDESDNNLPNILGQSLADDTDEDDSDFEEEDNDDGEEENDEGEDDHDSDEGGASQLKGVKMFKGLLKQKLKAADNDDDDDDNDDEEDDDDDDDDNDMDESNHKADTSMSPSGNKSKKGKAGLVKNEDEDDEDSEEDEDEDEEEDDDDEDSAPGLKDLLGNSIVDDDENDEDFEGEGEDDEDIDISDEELETDTEELEKEKRTIYVGNIPKDTQKQEIKKLFREFGIIESIRVRGVAPANIKVPKKVAAITKQIHKNVDHICMLIVFKNEESVAKALSINGKKFKGYYLRVDTAIKNKTKPDAKKAVFLGNLPFKVRDNDIWEHFSKCGEIEFVRLIRDKHSRMGKGIGYVNFKSEDSVPLALELDGSTILNREVRVKRCSDEKVSKSKNRSTNNRNKRSHPAESKVQKSQKKMKVDESESTSPVDAKKKIKGKDKVEENNSPNSEKKKTVFQGQKASVGKKVKKSKLDKKKKKIAAILTAKPKKIQKV